MSDERFRKRATPDEWAVFVLALVLAVIAFVAVVKTFLYAERLQLNEENKGRIERAKKHD